ncbi:MAG: PKD domain-containing protein [Thermoplasmatota archaeon]
MFVNPTFPVGIGDGGDELNAGRRSKYILIGLLIIFSFFLITNEETENISGFQTRDSNGFLNFTFLENGGFGSTAFRITDGSVVIYIEAFPASSACKLKPANVMDADIIIQETHGHGTHYDADSVYTVQSNSNATVVGNKGVIDDMKNKGVDSSNLVEMDPAMGSKVTTSIPKYGVNITAYGMPHTFISSTNVVTFLVEMQNGMKWFHGTCYSDSGSDKEASMRSRTELKNLDAMLLDFDHSFDKVETDFYPVVMCSHHDYNSQPYTATYWEEGYSTSNQRTLYHGDSFMYPPEYQVHLDYQSFSPPSGYTDTDFTIKTNYRYHADIAPSSADIFFSNGSSHPMVPDGSDWKEGVRYTYTTTVPHGSNEDLFHIEFQVNGDIYRLPAEGNYDGPNVRAYPVLSDPYLTPVNGNDDDHYTFEITYTDLDDDLPSTSYVYIDGKPKLMESSDLTYTDGALYSYEEKNLGVGDHGHYFIFSDGHNDVRLPETGEFSGPSVVRANYAPVLENGAILPASGYRSTSIEYSVNYRDSHGDEPSYARVVIDGETFDMEPEGSNFGAGVEFTFETKLDLGEHEYHFEFSDGEFDVRFPPEGELSGPVIDNNIPVAVIDYPLEGNEFTTEETIGFDGSSSRDSDDDDLNYTWSSSVDGILGYEELLMTALSEGSHTITLSVDDGFGGVSEDQIDILVIWYRPILNIDLSMDPEQPNEGDTVSVKAVLRNDGNGEASSVLLSIELNGENLASRNIPRIMAGGSADLKKDTTAVPGDHVIRASVEGGPVEYVNFSVAERPAPVADAGSDIEAVAGSEVLFDGSNSTFSGGAPLFRWDFDDGNQEYGISVTHKFNTPGIYNVTLTISDDLGKVSNSFVKVTIKPKVVEEEDTSDSGGASNIAVIAVSLVIGLLILITAALMILLLIRKKAKHEPESPDPPVDRLPEENQLVQGSLDQGNSPFPPPT